MFVMHGHGPRFGLKGDGGQDTVVSVSWTSLSKPCADGMQDCFEQKVVVS
jgi:hypothetical protein